MRSTVPCSSVRSPPKVRNCLGRACRLRGQNRVPPPPAMIIAWSMFGLVSVTSGTSVDRRRIRRGSLGFQFVGVEGEQRRHFDRMAAASGTPARFQPAREQRELSAAHRLRRVGPVAFFSGANSSSRRVSTASQRSASGSASKMNSSNFSAFSSVPGSTACRSRVDSAAPSCATWNGKPARSRHALQESTSNRWIAGLPARKRKRAVRSRLGASVGGQVGVLDRSRSGRR